MYGHGIKDGVVEKKEQDIIITDETN